MDTSNMLLPEDLPFPVPQFMARDIIDLADAYQREDIVDIAELRQELYGDGRALSEYQDDLLRDYYVNCMWRDYDTKEEALHEHFKRYK